MLNTCNHEYKNIDNVQYNLSYGFVLSKEVLVCTLCGNRIECFKNYGDAYFEFIMTKLKQLEDKINNILLPK